MNYTLLPPLLVNDLIIKRSESKSFNWNNEAFYFSLGRIALLNGIKLLASFAPEKKNVLVPDFICEEALWPLRDAGFNIIYYSVDDKFNFKLDEIESKINKNTLAVMVVHYFGIPQCLDNIKKLCQRKGAFLVEDCAHAFYGREGECWLGSKADISIFSIRKFLPVPDGGALVVNNDKLLEKAKQIKVSANKRKSKLLWLILRSFKNQFGLALRKRKALGLQKIEELCPRADLKMERKGFLNNESMSELSKRVFSRYDLDIMAAKRRENYNYLALCLKNLNSIEIPFPHVKDGWSPYVLPVYVEESVQSMIIKRFIDKGIMVSDWPLLPPDIPHESKAGGRPRRIVLFPVHQNVQKTVIDEIANRVKEGFKNITA